MATYEVGQRVKVRGMSMPGTIISGPHRTIGVSPRWLVTKADGNVSLLREGDLSAVRTPVEAAADIIARKVYMTSVDNLLPGSQRKCRDAASAIMAEIASNPRPVAVGDRVRILKTGLDAANVYAGETLTVREVRSGGSIITNRTRDGGGYWYFNGEHRGTGWELV